MHIVFEHSHPLPVKKYGGTERIIFWHMKELRRQGHRVTLIGHPQSSVGHLGVELIAQPKEYAAGEDWRTLLPSDTDMVHLFYTPSFDISFPLIVTIEGNGRPGENFHVNTVFISQRHARNHGSEVYVYNGIDLEEYPFQKRRDQKRWKDFLFLAKGSWAVKNLRDCKRACRQTAKHLHIAGGRAWSFSPYLHSYGMVDQTKKIELLRGVDALLFPVRWPEPFGIAVIEAYALGVPVIASPHGSLPELVETSTGRVVSSYEELVGVLSSDVPPFEVNPVAIRERVRERFAIEHMTNNYLNLYQRVLNGEELNLHTPRAQFQESAETLLAF